MGLMTVLLCLGVFVIAGSALCLALDVWNIRRELLPDMRKILLTMQRTYPVPGSPVFAGLHDGHRSQLMNVGFFAVWEWRDGEWILKTGLVPPGIHPGSPPAYPGAFNGDKIKTWVRGT
jgi:hypothetical protein